MDSCARIGVLLVWRAGNFHAELPSGAVMSIDSARIVLAAGVLMYSLAGAGDVPANRLYELVTETGMPHLEENLRYTITRDKRCLDDTQLSDVFPVLSHATLKGCTLGDERRQDDTISYALVCEGGRGTTGSATWRIGERQISGLLKVKLGGKNLTFYQSVRGRDLGACPAT